MASRKNDKIYVSYLPFDYYVFARNLKPDTNKNKIISVYKEFKDHNNKIVILPDDSMWDAYNWFKIKLSKLVQRTEEYLEKNNNSIVPEYLSEIFLISNNNENMEKLIN